MSRISSTTTTGLELVHDNANHEDGSDEGVNVTMTATTTTTRTKTKTTKLETTKGTVKKQQQKTTTTKSHRVQQQPQQQPSWTKLFSSWTTSTSTKKEPEKNRRKEDPIIDVEEGGAVETFYLDQHPEDENENETAIHDDDNNNSRHRHPPPTKQNDVETSQQSSKTSAAQADNAAVASSTKHSHEVDWTWQGWTVVILAVISFMVNVAAMTLTASMVMYLAGIMAILMAPVVVFFQTRLQTMHNLRTIQNDLRHDVNRLKEQNQVYVLKNTALEQEIAVMQEAEQRLDQITTSQGYNVQDFVALVQQNREFIEQQGHAVRHDAAQLLTSILITSDRNYNGKLSDRELSKLETRLRLLPASIGVDLPGLRHSLAASGGSVGKLLELTRRNLTATTTSTATNGNKNNPPPIPSSSSSERVFSFSVVQHEKSKSVEPTSSSSKKQSTKPARDNNKHRRYSSSV